MSRGVDLRSVTVFVDTKELTTEVNRFVTDSTSADSLLMLEGADLSVGGDDFLPSEGLFGSLDILDGLDASQIGVPRFADDPLAVLAAYADKGQINPSRTDQTFKPVADIKAEGSDVVGTSLFGDSSLARIDDELTVFFRLRTLKNIGISMIGDVVSPEGLKRLQDESLEVRYATGTADMGELLLYLNATSMRKNVTEGLVRRAERLESMRLVIMDRDNPVARSFVTSNEETMISLKILVAQGDLNAIEAWTKWIGHNNKEVIDLVRTQGLNNIGVRTALFKYRGFSWNGGLAEASLALAYLVIAGNREAIIFASQSLSNFDPIISLGYYGLVASALNTIISGGNNQMAERTLQFFVLEHRRRIIPELVGRASRGEAHAVNTLIRIAMLRIDRQTAELAQFSPREVVKAIDQITPEALAENLVKGDIEAAFAFAQLCRLRASNAVQIMSRLDMSVYSTYTPENERVVEMFSELGCPSARTIKASW